MKTYRCPSCYSRLGLPESEYSRITDLASVEKVAQVYQSIEESVGDGKGVDKSLLNLYERIILSEEIIQELATSYYGSLSDSINSKVARIAVISGWDIQPAQPEPDPDKEGWGG